MSAGTFEPGVFGYAMIELDDGVAVITSHDREGKVMASCRLTGRQARC